MPQPPHHPHDGTMTRPQARLGKASLWLLAIAVLVDVGPYQAADESGRQALLMPFARVVMALAAIGIVVALLSLFERGRRRGLALVSIPLHLLLAVGFCFALGMLA